MKDNVLRYIPETNFLPRLFLGFVLYSYDKAITVMGF